MSQTGSSYFKNLTSSAQRNEFFDKLVDELTLAIPACKGLIWTYHRFQIDTSLPEKPIVLSINVRKGDKRIIDNLNTLIRNKEVTVLASGNYSQYLDPEQGYTPYSKELF